MTSTLVALGVPVLTQILAEALKRVDHPVAQGAAQSLSRLDQILSQGQISETQMAEANRHAERMAEMQVNEAKAAFEQVNQSLRAEIGSSDAFVRRMRPTFGYLMAATWAAQMFGLAYVIIFRTAESPQVLEAMASLSTIWAVGLSVLGVYVYKRSEDKKIQSGLAPPAVPLPPRKPAFKSGHLND